MKHTAFTLSLAVACLSTANAAIEHQTTVLESSNTNGGAYYGFTLKLTDTFLSTTGTLGSSVYLDSITLTGRSGQSGDAFKIAVFEYTGDGTVGSLVGLSSASSAYTGEVGIKLDFSGEVISSDKQYQFLFVGSDTAKADIDTFDGYKNEAVSRQLTVSNRDSSGNNISLPSGDGLYKNNLLSTWEGMYMPLVSIATSVPEPTTATLSLLALAGLAARRRRK